MQQRFGRARFVAASAAAFASIAVIKSPARAAQFNYKYGTDQSISSPVTTRAKEMWAAVERETGGRLHVDTFPDSTLGGDTDMMAQVRSGALQFLTEAGQILGSVAPIAQISAVAFAFRTTNAAFAAVDGTLGELIRTEVGKVGVHVLSHPWDNGFREITANRPVRNVA
jgi:TRAP-type C4-dicarboxylate transport system substrate-binding protein